MGLNKHNPMQLLVDYISKCFHVPAIDLVKLLKRNYRYIRWDDICHDTFCPLLRFHSGGGGL